MKSIGAAKGGGSGSSLILLFLSIHPRCPYTSTITPCPCSFSCLSMGCVARWVHVALSKQALRKSYTSLPSYSPTPISVRSISPGTHTRTLRRELQAIVRPKINTRRATKGSTVGILLDHGIYASMEHAGWRRCVFSNRGGNWDCVA